MYSNVFMLASIDAMAIIGELIVLSNSSKNNKDAGQPVFNLVILLLILATFSDLVSWPCMKVSTGVGKFIGMTAGFGNYLLPNIAWWIWLLYAYSFISKTHTKSMAKAFFICSSIPVILSLAANILNVFTGIYFYYNDSGEYIRGQYYWLNMIFSVIYISWFMILMLMDYSRSSDKKHKKYIRYLFGFAILPVMGLLSEQLFFGLYFAPMFTFFGTLMIYLNVQRERIDDAETEKETAVQNLKSERTKVMLSQIKPHFLFNTLNIIRSLVIKQPDTAVEAIDHFADYLRENMATLDENQCVRFTEELHHVENYIYIEKLRFGDHLNVEYDIRSSEFKLPPLSLQILVENAVKHGISPKEEPGTVKIKTDEDQDFHIILCEDDGVGFDTGRKLSLSHVGLRNTKMRLHSMCGGELVVDSTIGKGTRAVIMIPKNQK